MSHMGASFTGGRAKQMTVSVLVPFRSDGAHRQRSWEFLRAKWREEFPSWEVIEGHCPDDGPWVKALAVEDALARATCDTLIIADADCWSDGIEDTVDALSSAAWAVPHMRVHRLTESATEAVLAGRAIEGDEFAEEPYVGAVGGGMVAIPRTLYEEAPLDPRFAGWGQEDMSAALAWSILGGEAKRGYEPLWHLWHPAPQRLNRYIGTHEGRDLYNRYREAGYSATKMKAIIREFKA
jgi:hypothetical protein